MASAFDRIFQSELFTFHVGPDKKPIIVHSGVVAKCSESLNSLMNNGMAESQRKWAELEDVEEDDFVRFCQYAYTGDYTAPSAAVVEDSDILYVSELALEEPEGVPEGIGALPAEPETISSTNGWDGPPRPRIKKPGKKTKKSKSAFALVEEPQSDTDIFPRVEIRGDGFYDESKKQTTLRQSVKNKSYCLTTPRLKYLEECEPSIDNQKNEDYTPIFLAHARLYEFADRYNIRPLRLLALHKLHRTLMDFRLFTARISDVVELARYVYDHTNDRKNRIDGLRSLVLHYIASEIDVIGTSTEFDTLMMEGGDFVRDFWKLVQKNLL